jgi:deoxyribonuclease V
MISIEEAEKLQLKLAKMVVSTDEFAKPPMVIAGCDVEYDKDSEFISGAIVLLDYATKKVIEVATHFMQVSFPYLPGLFSFRETPPLLEAYKKLKIKPDLIICDGHGIAHPRRFGFASHLGVELGVPTIGCAKTRLYGNYKVPLPERGAMSDLLADDNHEIIGRVLRTQKGINPVFVSVGHRISLDSACQIVLNFATDYRLPETTRLSDQFAREYMEKIKRNK